MERDIDEIVASQARMLDRLKREGGKLDAEQLRRAMSQSLDQARAMLEAHGIPRLAVRYANAVDDPVATIDRVANDRWKLQDALPQSS